LITLSLHCAAVGNRSFKIEIKSAWSVVDLSGIEESMKAFLETHLGVAVNLHKEGADHRAAWKDRYEILDRLQAAKTNLMLRDGRTPLLLASAEGDLGRMKVLIESKADVQTADDIGDTAAHTTSYYGEPECLEALINANADVNVTNSNGYTPAMRACQEDHLACLQLLLHAKADLSASEVYASDFVHLTMRFPNNQSAHRVSGMPFAVLSCDTNTKSVRFHNKVTQAMVDAHIDEYKRIQNFIDDYHDITKYALSEDVVVDTRVGRRGTGLYHEPLEQVLLYLGISLTKDQTVNKSIDGNTVTRALIPGHPTNANLWFELYKRASVLHLSKLPPGWGCVDPRQRASDKKKYEPQFTIKKKRKKKKR
jgi:hypothetical protein